MFESVWRDFHSLVSTTGLLSPGPFRNHVFGAATHRPGVWKPHNAICALACAQKYPYAFRVGEPWTYVQAPKAKGPRSCALSAFQLPDLGFQGQFAGAHRRGLRSFGGGQHDSL